MSYVVLSILVVLLSGIYEKIKNLNEKSKGLQYILLATICLCLCVFAGLRTAYNDTSIYIGNGYSNSGHGKTGWFSIDKVLTSVNTADYCIPSDSLK